MPNRLPSLELLLGLVQGERDKQLAHFDALDAKAGVVLAFAGLLVTLAPDVSSQFRLSGVLLALNAGSDVLQEKGRRVRFALMALSLAAAAFGAGIVADAL